MSLSENMRKRNSHPRKEAETALIADYHGSMSTTTATTGTEHVTSQLIERHGEEHRTRIESGVARCAELWQEADGDDAAFATFCLDHFVADSDDLDRLVERLETSIAQVRGHLYEMRRTLRRWADLRGDEMANIDELLATFDPAPDLSEQVYIQKLAHLALLNLDRPSLTEMLEHGDSWSTEDWARSRISRHFGARVPKDVADMARDLGFKASHWVSNFHVPVGTMVDATGKRWFESDRKLVAHWLIREELKAGYNEPDGIHKQRALAWVLGRHIDGSIPRSVMDGTNELDWDPGMNTLGGEKTQDVVGLERYDHWMMQVEVAKALDPHHPEHPTAISRKCELHREIPEADVEKMLVDLLSADVRKDLSAKMEHQLGRELEAHDVYYDDLFESRKASEMDDAVRALFEDEKAFERKLPEVLRGLGFEDELADFLGTRIRVEIGKGAGHAMRPMLHQYDAWLRTSRLKNELGWDGFDTAMHELGHNLEQLCSCYFAPRPILEGVPNTACTEAFAFLYQSLAKQVLGIEDAAAAQRAFHETTLSTMLMACQIAGPSLMELRTWRWIYENPKADAAALRETVLRISDDVWSEFFADHFGQDPYRILGAYQHMVAHPLYLPDYAIGQMISHQVRAHVRNKDIAVETKRICSIGRLTPAAWMKVAVGGELSAMPLIKDSERAIKALG